MKRLLGWGGALLVGAMAAGCTGPQGAMGKPGIDGQPGMQGTPGMDGRPGSGTPSVSALLPESAFLARTLDVAISGNGTTWSTKATVDFGDAKIKVNKLTVASPTGLVANITVASDAKIGTHDVKVTDDAGGTETYTGAFTVASPLKVSTAGSLAQGSVITVHGRGLDVSTPFDTTSVASGLSLSYPDIAVATPAGMSASVDNVSDFAVDYTLLVDVMTPAATVDVDVTSGPMSDTTDFPAPAALAIAARTPTKVPAGMTVGSMIANSGDSALLSYTPASASLKIVDFTVSSTDMMASPVAYFLPKSGKFADIFAATTQETQAVGSTDPFFFVGVDTTGYAGYTLNIKAVETAATGATEMEPNDTTAQAMTNGIGTAPFVIQGASLSGLMDVDTYAINITAADVGKQLWVQTTGLDLYTDTVVDILDPMGMSTLGGPSSDLGYLDTLLSTTLPAAGTYFVQITVSQAGYFKVADNKYDVCIRVQ